MKLGMFEKLGERRRGVRALTRTERAVRCQAAADEMRDFQKSPNT
jgi:hypothetical protein